MSSNSPILHLVCGKIAAGKSTLAAQLSAHSSTVLISEDVWLSRLFPDEILTVDDYIRCSRRLRDAMGEHVGALLCTGVSVVLDFPANTVRIRRWMRGISDGAGVEHELHYIDVSDELCKARQKKRNQDGGHEFAATESEFDLLATYFMPPTPDEGLNLTVHSLPE